jgi:hypothetical protein
MVLTLHRKHLTDRGGREHPPRGHAAPVRLPRRAAIEHPIEHPDVIEPQGAALKDSASRTILTVDPPGEVQQQLLKAALEPFPVALPFLRLFQADGGQ